MTKILERLLELQAADRELESVRTRVAAFPKKLAEVEHRVAAGKSELEASKAAQVGAVRDRKKYELDVEQWKERVRKYRDQMAQVKTNEAYKALQHETQTAEAEIARAEDRLLEEMVAAEEYDRRVKGAERSLKAAEEAARLERERIGGEKASAEKELAEREAARAEIVREVPEDLLDHYTRIARRHNGLALAEVREERCGACGMRVRPQVSQQMQRGDAGELFHCETCTRILYYPDAAESHAGELGAAAGSAATRSGAPGNLP